MDGDGNPEIVSCKHPIGNHIPKIKFHFLEVDCNQNPKSVSQKIGPLSEVVGMAIAISIVVGMAIAILLRVNNRFEMRIRIP